MPFASLTIVNLAALVNEATIDLLDFFPAKRLGTDHFPPAGPLWRGKGK